MKICIYSNIIYNKMTLQLIGVLLLLHHLMVKKLKYYNNKKIIHIKTLYFIFTLTYRSK